MSFIQNYIKELESLPSDGTYSLATIEWWLLKYQEEYKRIKEEESKRFMYFIDDNWVRLPDYFDLRTPNERFLKIYDTLNKITDFHKQENYFKQEMAIYKNIKNDHQKVKKWLAKNEHFGAEKYFSFSLEIDISINLDREDFKYTLEFIESFDKTYWNLLEELNLDTLN